MMDIGSITGGIKSLANLAQEVGKLELYKQAVELMGQVTDLAVKNLELSQQNADLQRKLEVKGQVTYDIKSHTYQLNGKGVFCATCYDQHGTLQRLHAASAVSDQKHADEMGIKWTCGRCGWKSDWTHMKRDVIEWPNPNVKTIKRQLPDGTTSEVTITESNA